jgi:hypothetical protein
VLARDRDVSQLEAVRRHPVPFVGGGVGGSRRARCGMPCRRAVNGARIRCVGCHGGWGAVASRASASRAPAGEQFGPGAGGWGAAWAVIASGTSERPARQAHRHAWAVIASGTSERPARHGPETRMGRYAAWDIRTSRASWLPAPAATRESKMARGRAHEVGPTSPRATRRTSRTPATTRCLLQSLAVARRPRHPPAHLGPHAGPHSRQGARGGGVLPHR